MVDEKILKDEKLSDEELDGVAGGTRRETFQDGEELYKRGLLSEDDSKSISKISEAIHNLGYKYAAHGGIKGWRIAIGNKYFDKNGEKISREDFWKNFDAENGTKIIR